MPDPTHRLSPSPTNAKRWHNTTGGPSSHVPAARRADAGVEFHERTVRSSCLRISPGSGIELERGVGGIDGSHNPIPMHGSRASLDDCTDRLDAGDVAVADASRAVPLRQLTIRETWLPLTVLGCLA